MIFLVVLPHHPSPPPVPRKSLIHRGDLQRALKEAEGALEDYAAAGIATAEAAAHGALASVRQARNEVELAISESLGAPDFPDFHGLKRLIVVNNGRWFGT
jgi:hypothetical protein